MSFLTSWAIILLSALLLGGLFRKIKLPSLIGVLLVGMILSPHVLNLISNDILNVSSDLRQVALIIILTRAGLSLRISDLKTVGRPAILLCFVPATAEIIGYMLFAPLVLKLSLAESALLGSVMGAVSPAVVVPRMLKLQNENYGTNKCIPQMITAGSSCDDVFVIVLFTALLTTVSSGDFDFNIIWKIPMSIVSGIFAGILIGLLYSRFFEHFHIRDTVKTIMLLCISFLFVALENIIKEYFPFSGLLSIISLGVMFNMKSNERAERLTVRYEKLWVVAEIVLFVLVGAEVDISYFVLSGGVVLIVLFAALIFRMIGVLFCLIKTSLNFKERLFCAIAYMPKATVQAAIGAVPLSVGLPCGKIILTCAVAAILVTAPVGAFATDISYKKLLSNEKRVE